MGRRTPPKAQATLERWSLVYFHRPHNGVMLEALTADSVMIAGAVASSSHPDKFKTGETADAWMMRRVKMRRTKNMTVSSCLQFTLVKIPSLSGRIRPVGMTTSPLDPYFFIFMYPCIYNCLHRVRKRGVKV